MVIQIKHVCLQMLAPAQTGDFLGRGTVPGQSGSGKVSISQEGILVIQEPWRS